VDVDGGCRPATWSDTMDAPIESTTLSAADAYAAHAGPLLHFLERRTRDHDLAEDLVGECFLRLAREEAAGRTPAHTRGWLHRVALNLLMSHGRHATVARRELARLAPEELHHPCPESEAAARETLAEALGAVRRLPEGERRAIALAAAGCTNREMATALGVSAEAARARLCRARAHLVAAMAA
jgi:RNA polymerase sigma-70 factor, ECF subfamily